MKGPNSGRPLRATSSSLVTLIAVSIISASSLASTGSAKTVRYQHPRQPQHREIRASNHGINDEEFNYKIQEASAPLGLVKEENLDESHFSGSEHGTLVQDNIEKFAINREDGKFSSERIDNRKDRAKDEIRVEGKSSINRASSSSVINAAGSNVDQEGIRRFDAIVVNEETVVPISDRDKENSKNRIVENSKIDKTVTKAIIVRDEPLDADGIRDEKLHDIGEIFSKLKDHRKRSLKDPQSDDADTATRENGNEQIEISKVDTSDKNVEPAKSRQVPVLIPVGAGHARPSEGTSSKHDDESSIALDERMQEKSSKHAKAQDGLVDERLEIDNSGLDSVESTGSILESVQAHEKPVDKLIESNDNLGKKDIVAPDIKKIIIYENGLGVVEKEPEEQISDIRTVAMISEDDDDRQGYTKSDRGEGESKSAIINRNTLDSVTLPSILRTNVSLDELKAQAILLQGSIKNKTFLQRLRDDAIEILPQIPKFTEGQAFDALKMIYSLEKTDNNSEESYLSKMDTSMLSEGQLKIVKCAEALIVREQRQTFAENMFECIRGLSILNCMRIFVWPVIADNIPQSLSQNLPTLPIEVNVADWLSGDQREKPKSSKLHSATSSHQRRLITPELVVTNILKDALSAYPKDGANLATFIDPKNETMSKLLTAGQLEILRMAEMFLPESTRQEYSERMYSCVRRFEYFSCVKYFTWPMVKQHFAALPEFPDYQSWYPNTSHHSGYPILPYPNVEGVSQLPEVVEADATRTKSPRPEAVIVQILENTLREASRIPNLRTTYYSTGHPGAPLAHVSADQMAIFYTAEQLIPVPMRPEFMYKTMKCIRDYDYLTCTKYSTWPTVRQLYPGLPQFPDFSSWIPTFAVPELPDFSEYIPNFGSYFPTFPGFPGGESSIQPSQPEPQPQPQPQPEPQPPLLPQTQPQPQPPLLPQTQPQPQPPLLPQTQPQPQPPLMPQTQLQPQLPLLPQTQPQPQPPSQSQPQPPLQPQTQLQPQLPLLPQTQPQPQPPSQSQPQPPLQPNPDRPSYLPQPQPIPNKPPYHITETNSNDFQNLSKEDHRLSQSTNTIENRIIEILSNIRWTVLTRNAQQIAPVTQATLAVLGTLTYNQLKIFGLSKSFIPEPVRGDLDARFVGCLQGGSDFLSCTRNIIWPTLQLYVKDMPIFPQEEKLKNSDTSGSPTGPYTADTKVAGLPERYVITPGIYQPIVRSSAEIAARSPLGGQIIAETEEELPSLNAPSQSQFGIPSNLPISHSSDGQLRQEVIEKPSDPSTPLISITDTSFTPIFSDHPETVLLKILMTVGSSSKFTDNLQPLESSGGYLESLNDYLSLSQKSVIQVSENLLPMSVRSNFAEKISGCIRNSNFVACTRDIVWPTVAKYYPRLPSFPNFNINDDSMKNIEPGSLVSKKSMVPGAGVASSAISETDVKTGQHGDATVTITDTRFVPIFSEHPEELILGILKNLKISSPSLSMEQYAVTKPVDKSAEFIATFTDQQGNIITTAESLLPESIRQVFNKRMTECAKENGFLDCTRDIAWPTIAQFFPRLPNFPNIGEQLPGLTADNAPGQQPTLLPPHLEPAGMLGPAIPTKTTLALPTENFIRVTPEDELESLVESTLRHISSTTKTTPQSKQTYLSNEDPLVSTFVTERQASVIRMCEDLLPNSIKPIFIGKMLECSRIDVFTNCIRNVGWPTLRQYVPSIPEFPDIGNFGTYFPQVPQEIPQTPQFPDYQLPVQLPNLGSFGLPGPAYVYPFQAAHDRVSYPEGAYIPQGSMIADGGQPSGFYLRGIQGVTPSVDSTSVASSGIRTGSTGYSFLVPAGYPSSRTTDLSSDDKSTKIDLQSFGSSERRRERRSLDAEPSHNHQDISFDYIEPLPLNVTESEFLEILINITKQRKNHETKNSEAYFIERFNKTMKEALSGDQYRILMLVEDINSQTAKAGFMSKIMQCITSLSFIRCMGIFVWPVITQNVPSLLGLPTLGDLNPFGRSRETSDFHDLFGMTRGEFETELLARKENVEGILVDWYRGLMEDKFDEDYGFMRVRGYGDGEIGISFKGFGRNGRGAKIKDNKNLPSILTILSDIMEDVLDQRDPRPEHDKKKEQQHGKRDNFRRDKSLRERIFIDDYDRVSTVNSIRESSNDDKIIAMFLDKIRSNGTGENGVTSESNNYVSVENAYGAFELLFGTRLSDGMAERLNVLRKMDSRDPARPGSVGTDDDHEGNNREEKRSKDIRTGLVIKLPRIDEEFVSRKTTSGLMDLGRKMKMEMSQIMPGISFVVSFFIQMALAHARAAASVAGMMSNMALGSAVLTMIRNSLFGSMTEPKIKYVYDNAAMGPGITWPQHN